MDGLMLTSELIAPYRHLVFASLVSDVVEQDLLKTLENAAWVSRAASFYRFDVIEDSNIRLALLRMIVDDAGLRNRRPEFEDIFECRLSNDFKLESHRYGNGAGIGAAHGRPDARGTLCFQLESRLECKQRRDLGSGI